MRFDRSQSRRSRKAQPGAGSEPAHNHSEKSRRVCRENRAGILFQACGRKGGRLGRPRLHDADNGLVGSRM
ncbi:MAG: hypothetical protein BJ554DRAFT_7667 [Olpidium bornovanus]|uniref:Uncharacterized protein n=1 Tax=Olpidium bornovanus TaxID=278681 RepID=A0A8H8DIX7_9FUNG|nr:MAG: hypothetical protein BJ554DRAFT_7667 [Olpidium bornovanus]